MNGSRGRPASLLDVLLLPTTPVPNVSGDVSVDTLTAEARSGKLGEHPVWAAVYAAARGVAEAIADSATQASAAPRGGSADEQ